MSRLTNTEEQIHEFTKKIANNIFEKVLTFKSNQNEVSGWFTFEDLYGHRKGVFLVKRNTPITFIDAQIYYLESSLSLNIFREETPLSLLDKMIETPNSQINIFGKKPLELPFSAFHLEFYGIRDNEKFFSLNIPANEKLAVYGYQIYNDHDDLTDDNVFVNCKHIADILIDPETESFREFLESHLEDLRA